MRNVLTMIKFAVVMLAGAVVVGCQTAVQHSADVAAANPGGNELTVGIVQKEIRIGMSGGEVAQVLGSPNIVSTDEKRREVWIYDKTATTATRSSSSGGVFLILGVASSGASASATNQKTLTVVIKFDEQKLVRDFAYHTSTF